MEPFQVGFREYQNRRYSVAESKDGVPQVRSKMTYKENYEGAGLTGCGGSCRPYDEFSENFRAIYDCDQVNDIIGGSVKLERELVRLDNAASESAPVPPEKPGFFNGLFHPQRKRDYKEKMQGYEEKKQDWDAHLHGPDLDPRPGHVRVSTPELEAQLSFLLNDAGQFKSSKLEFDNQLWGDGPEHRHGSMVRSGDDFKIGTQAIHFWGDRETYQQLKYDASKGTISTVFGKTISRNRQGDYHDLKCVFGKSELDQRAQQVAQDPCPE